MLEAKSPPCHSLEDFEALRDFVAELTRLRVVREVQASESQVTSPIFLTKNHDGSARLILDLSRINKACVRKIHFKMETLREIIRFIRPGDFCTSLDLVKGFFNVPLHPDQRNYFCFRFQGKVFEFCAMPMGSTDAPRIFTMLMRAVLKFLRGFGVRVFCYLDDTLILGETREICLRSTIFVGRVLEALGFFIHPKKSDLEPTQIIRFLGFQVDSRRMTVALPQEKIRKLRGEISKLRQWVSSGSPVRLRKYASVVGFMLSCSQAHPYAMAHFRSFEVAKEQAFKNGATWDSEFVVPDSILEDLAWWESDGRIWERSFAVQDAQFRIFTDASQSGWGAKCSSHKVAGVWAENEEHHIGYLELLATLKALHHLPLDFRNAQVNFVVDSVTAKAYLNKLGGRVPELDHLARQIWSFLEERNSLATAVYVPSRDNPADPLSRSLTRNWARFLDIEWQLDPEVFSFICREFSFYPNIDWFASPENYQVERFVTWEDNPEAFGTDAFFFDWSGWKGYFFPPCALLSRVLTQMQRQKVSGILIHPCWSSQTWWPLLQFGVQTIQLGKATRILRLPQFPHLRHRLSHLSLAATLFLETNWRA